MKLLENLNPRQREAVLATEGPLLVLAGAGSGKTRVLTYRIAHLVHNQGIAPRAILAFTFTNKAAAEMKERVALLLGGSPRDLWVGTFHATGVRILRLKGLLLGIDPGFSIYDTDDQEGVIRRIFKDKNLAERELTPKGVRSAISGAKNALLSPSQYRAQADSFRGERIAEVFVEYQKRLREANALDFDDLIGETIRLFETHPEVRRLFADRFRYVLVDEYQDTNAAQVRLIHHLASGHENLCVVGDDDQSIYGWRGADIGNILSFEALYPKAKVVRLEQNYRSTQNILSAANAVVKHNQARKEKTLWTEREDGDRLRLTVTVNEEDEARQVVARVTEEIQVHGVPPSEVAVLYRTNAQSRALEAAFRNAAIPYELVGGTAFYQRREIKDLLAYLRLAVNDLDDLAFLRAVNVPRRGIGATSLQRLTEHAYREGTSLYRSLATIEDAAGVKSAAKKRLGEFQSIMEEFRARRGQRVDEVLRDLVERVGYLDYLRHNDPETAGDRIENVEELVAGARLFTERAETPDLSSFLNEVALLTDVDRYDANAEKVLLMTIHNAKGLEFRAVCVVGLEEGLLPHVSSMDSDTALEEERRLFYVALTRAMDRVHLFSAVSRQRWGGSTVSLLSRFVEEIPEGLLNVEERPRAWGGSSRNRRFTRDQEPEYAEPGPRRTLGTVIHSRFGRGDVIRREGTGPDARLTVVFEGNLQKKILARFLQWEDFHVDS